MKIAMINLIKPSITSSEPLPESLQIV